MFLNNLTKKLTNIFMLMLTVSIFSFSCSEQDKTKINEIPDSKIKKAVNDNLILDDFVRSYKIDVKVNDGIVTLTGNVDNIIRKDRAGDIAESIKGVRSVVNRVNVQVPDVPDDSIVKKAERTFLRDPALESYEITFKAQDGTLTMEGQTDSWAEKQLSEKVAKSIEGVSAVENDIDVEYDEVRPDIEIKAEIEKRLKFNPYIFEGLIDVNVTDGNVTLSGEVGSMREKSLARGEALIYGVKSVSTENLEVKWWMKDEMMRASEVAGVSDEQIKDAIKDALIYDPRVLMFEVEPEVSNGYVTLTGTVANLKAKRAAQQDAENTIGVVVVDNQIKVEPEDYPEDAELKQVVSDILLFSPGVKRSEIDIAVDDGKVTLKGTLATNYQIQRAIDIVSKITGLKEIENNLKLEIPAKVYNDELLEQQIQDRLKWSYMVTSEDLSVEADAGTVTITGYVDSWQEYYAVVNNAIEGGALILKTDIQIEEGRKVERMYHFDYFYPYYL